MLNGKMINKIASDEDNKWRQVFVIIAALVILLPVNISAHSDEDFAQAEALMNQSVSCNQFTDEQLELIGDYYMEQMHPGEAHEYMDQMMGGEGSESLRQMHINIASRIYCGETSYAGYGMMGSYNGMMGNYYYYGKNNLFVWIFNIILIVGLVLLIILLVKQVQRKNIRR